MMFPHTALDRAAQAMQLASAQAVRIVTAETCTAGLVSSCLTSVPGASKTFERGFVLYHESAKATGLGVPEAVSRQYGAVSAEVTKGLAEGALAHSTAGVSVAVTGYAGPGGGNERNAQGRRDFRRTSRLLRRPGRGTHSGGRRCPDAIDTAADVVS
jgi:nicotinamide-nucleotide amidase